MQKGNGQEYQYAFYRKYCECGKTTTQTHGHLPQCLGPNTADENKEKVQGSGL